MEALCIYFYMKEGGNKMKLIMSLLEKYLMPFSNKITSNKLLNAIKDACILTSPFTVVGSLAGLVSQQANYWFGEWSFPNKRILRNKLCLPACRVLMYKKMTLEI